MRCRDPITRMMNERGFNAVRHPRAGIMPGELIGSQSKTMEALGSMSLAFESSDAFPDLSDPVPAADFQGHWSRSFNLRIGVTVLDQILKLIGSGASLAAHYSGARSVSFMAEDVTMTRVVPLEVSRWMQTADLSEDAPLLIPYIAGEGDLYVITETIQARKLKIKATRKDKAGLEVDLPSIKNVVGGSLKVDGSLNKEGVLTYESQTPAVFGFKAIAIDLEGPGIVLRNAAPGTVQLKSLTATKTSDEEETHDLLMVEGARLHLVGR